MRPTRLTTKLLASAFGLALGAALLAMPAPARAADDDDSAVAPDTKFFRSILEGLGLQRDGNGINYQERAPLVIPSSRTLPPPEKSDSASANNPAWPVDPDVQRAKAEARAERQTQGSAGEQFERSQSVMRQSELTPGPKPRNARRSASTTGSSAPEHEYGDVMSPSQLGSKKGLFSNIFGHKDEESAKFTGEPPRASLTEPPPGYQTPSPDQPYGVGQEKPAAPKAGAFQENHPVDGL